MTYTVEIKKSAIKALRRLDRSTLDKIKKAIDKLAHNPVLSKVSIASASEITE